MPKDVPRKLRVGGQIQRELTQLIAEGYSDSRLRLVTFTAVDMSPDLKHARVYVSRMGLDVAEALEALREQAPRMRGEVGRRLHMRHAPELRFVGDSVPEAAERLDRLIRGAIADDERHRR